MMGSSPPTRAIHCAPGQPRVKERAEQSPVCLSRFLSSFTLPCPLVTRGRASPSPAWPLCDPGKVALCPCWGLSSAQGQALGPPPHLKGCQLHREPCIWEGHKRLPDTECEDSSNTRSAPGRPGGSVRPRLRTAETASGKPDPPPPRAQPPEEALAAGQRRVAVVEAVPMCKLLPWASLTLTRTAGGAREPAPTTRGPPHPPAGQRWQRPMWGCGTGLGHHTL